MRRTYPVFAYDYYYGRGRIFKEDTANRLQLIRFGMSSLLLEPSSDESAELFLKRTRRHLLADAPRTNIEVEVHRSEAPLAPGQLAVVLAYGSAIPEKPRLP